MLNTDKITNYMRKSFKWKLLKIEFLIKNSVGVYDYLHKSGGSGLQRLICLKYYNVLKREIRFTLGLSAAKTTDYMKDTSSKTC